MGLLVLDHLQPVLNGPEKHICGVQVRRHIAAYDSSIAQGNEGVAGARRAQFAVASAMNELMHLSEEFDLPNAAPSSEERRVGKAWGSTWRSRWSQEY